jgi:hypothetical protein
MALIKRVLDQAAVIGARRFNRRLQQGWRQTLTRPRRSNTCSIPRLLLLL